MTVKIARMANGEDVIADIKEVRSGEGDDARILAYEFVEAYSVTLETDEQDFLVESLDEELPPETPQLNNIRMRFFPYFPLTVGSNFITLNAVVSIADPHLEVLKRYNQARYQTTSEARTDAIQVDYSEAPPSDLLIG